MPQIAETKTVSAIFVIPLSGRIVNIVRLRGMQFVNKIVNTQITVHSVHETFSVNFIIFPRFTVSVHDCQSQYHPQISLIKLNYV